MELSDLFEQVRSGTFECPKCHESGGMSLPNVRVSLEAGKPKADPNTFGFCKKCGARVSIEKLLRPKLKWQFWNDSPLAIRVLALIASLFLPLLMIIDFYLNLLLYARANEKRRWRRHSGSEVYE